MSQFVSGKDVFAVLPTSYGKRLCFAILPFVFDAAQTRDYNWAIVIVKTPLVAIKELAYEHGLKGLKTAYTK